MLSFKNIVRSAAGLSWVSVLMFPSGALAWGQHGHAVICELTYRQLEPEIRKTVDELMLAHPDDERLNTACAWADRFPRKKPKQHYINFARDLTKIETATCGEAKTCIFTALSDDFKTLSEPDNSDEDRAEAMVLLGHWIGDIHQPMHVGFADDRGGNSLHVKRDPSAARKLRPCRAGTDNLHAVWDGCLVESKAPKQKKLFGLTKQADILSHADRLAAMKVPVSGDANDTFSPVVWANESLALVRDPPIQYCRLKDNSDFCAYDAERDTYVPIEGQPYDGARSFTVTQGYVDFASPIAERRLVQAAQRYAAALTLALANQLEAETPLGNPGLK